jgi:hypothetical protein
MDNATTPLQLHLIAGKVLEFVAMIECSEIEKMAALKVAASIIDEAANAQNRAIMVANLMRNSGGK